MPEYFRNNKSFAGYTTYIPYIDLPILLMVHLTTFQKLVRRNDSGSPLNFVSLPVWTII